MNLKVDQSTARAMNRRLILNLLREKGPLSRADIATTVGLSGATVGFAVGDLLTEGLVREGEPSSGATGRRPIPIEINYSGLLAVGLKLMVGSVECVLTNLSTTPLITRIIPLVDQSPETIVQVCAQRAVPLAHASPASASPCPELSKMAFVCAAIASTGRMCRWRA